MSTLLGDPTKAKDRLGWQPQISFDSLIKEMVAADLESARCDAVISREGFTTYRYLE